MPADDVKPGHAQLLRRQYVGRRPQLQHLSPDHPGKRRPVTQRHSRHHPGKSPSACDGDQHDEQDVRDPHHQIDAPGDHGRHDCELRGDLEAAEDLGEDGGGGADGFAEVSVEDTDDPVQVLDDIGPVQPIFGGQLGAELRCGFHTQNTRDDIAGNHFHDGKDEDADTKQNRDEL